MSSPFQEYIIEQTKQYMIAHCPSIISCVFHNEIIELHGGVDIDGDILYAIKQSIDDFAYDITPSTILSLVDPSFISTDNIIAFLNKNPTSINYIFNPDQAGHDNIVIAYIKTIGYTTLKPLFDYIFIHTKRH